MGFKIPKFGKKAGGGDDGPKEQLSGKSVAMNARVKDDRVLPESVFETMASVMRQNERFVVRRDDDVLFVGAYLKLDDIGGLSKKDMRDESKGAIVNAISTGTLSSLYTAELAKENAIIFIPNKDTVEFMNDFSLLADSAVYELVLVDPGDESVEHTDVRVSHATLVKIHGGKETVRGLLGDVLADAHVEDHRSPSDPFRADEDDDEGVSDDDDGGEIPGAGEYDFGGDGVPDEGEPDFGDDDEVPPDVEPDAGPEPGGPSAADPVSGDGPGPEDDVRTEDDVFVGVEESKAVVSRRFFNPALSRELTTDGLDQRLASLMNASLIEYQSETWLGAKANALIAAANRSLSTVHAYNLATVRGEYLSRLQAEYAERMRGVDDLTSDSRYAMVVGVVEEKIMGVLDERVAAEKKRLEDSWQQKLNVIGEQSRNAAIQNFVAKYGASHEDELTHAEHQIRLSAETRVEQARSQLRELRLSEVQSEMDAVDSKLLDEAFEKYAELCQAEMELARKNQAEILGYVEAHRAEEVAHDKVAAEHADRAAVIESLNAEWTAKCDSMRTDFESRIATMALDLAAARDEHRAEVERRERELRDAAKRSESLVEGKDRRIDQLVRDMADMDAKTQAKYQNQVNNLTTERDLLSTKYGDLVEKYKGAERRGLLQMLAGAVVALAVGLVVGFFVFGGGRPSAPVDPTIILPGQTQDDGSVAPPDASTTPGVPGGDVSGAASPPVDEYGGTIFNDD